MTGTESKSNANQFTQPVLTIFKCIQQFKSKKFSRIREEEEYFLDKHSITLEF